MSDQLIDTVLIIKKALYRERQQKLLLLFFMLVTTFLLLYAASFQQETSLYRLCAIASLLTFVLTLLLFRDLLRSWNPQSAPLLQMIVQAPKNIVWIYRINIQFSPFGIDFGKKTNFCFRLLNRDTLQIQIPEKDAALLMENLERYFTNASFGYSREKEQLYGIHPELLQKD